MTEDRVAHDPRFRSGPPARAASSLPPVPAVLAPVVASATSATQVWVKQESEVWRLDLPAARAYLKIVDDPAPFREEVERLRWAHGRTALVTPEVLGEAVDDRDRGWFVTDTVPGTPAHDPSLARDPEALVRSIARGLRRLHDHTDVDGCPFAASVDDLLASAEARVARGGVDPSTMRTAAHRVRTAGELLDHLIEARPDEPATDRVVSHGDPCQPNLMIDAASADLELVGLVDLGRLAVSDRYRDLAIAARSIDQKLGPEASGAFLEAYGAAADDRDRLAWWTLVDDVW